MLEKGVQFMVSFVLYIWMFILIFFKQKDVARTRKLPEKIDMQTKSTSRYRRELPDIIARVSLIYSFIYSLSNKFDSVKDWLLNVMFI